MRRKCKNCGKDISNKHINASFCSNKGVRNCKDRYHNRLNPRGYGINAVESIEDDINFADAMEHLSECGDTGDF